MKNHQSVKNGRDECGSPAGRLFRLCLERFSVICPSLFRHGELQRRSEILNSSNGHGGAAHDHTPDFQLCCGMLLPLNLHPYEALL
jgi:hypothetical protein